jgi:hypothetical protein
MFDAKYLDGIARNYVLAIAEKKLGVSKKMVELLDWEYMKHQAEAGEWVHRLKPRTFAELYTKALIESEYQVEEMNELLCSKPQNTGWAEHFTGFINGMKHNGYDVIISWEVLGDSKYDFSENAFMATYESTRNLWVPPTMDNRFGTRGFWGRPTVVISWGKALQTTDAINILREKEDTTMDIEEDSFLTRF